MKTARLVFVFGLVVATFAHSADRNDVAAVIRATECARLRALVAADTASAGPLHADDFQLINPFGGTVTKREYLEAVGSGIIDYLSWEPVTEIEVKSGKDWAAIRYRAKIEVIVQGTPLPPTELWHTDLYELRAGRWEIVWSHATEIKPPPPGP